jgi:hypothetical protein
LLSRQHDPSKETSETETYYPTNYIRTSSMFVKRINRGRAWR